MKRNPQPDGDRFCDGRRPPPEKCLLGPHG